MMQDGVLFPVSTSYVPLARKYRPRTFRQLIGQDIVVRTLKGGIERGRLGYGLIFTGIRGTGKTTTARLVAQALNCSERQGVEPCGYCSSCEALIHGKSLDVIEIDAASYTGVDDVRDVIDSSHYRPLQGSFKIFIIDEVHMLSRSAFNALLKTLEEPPAHVKFLFATTEIQKVPATVLSRCLRFDLQRVPEQTIQGHLEWVCEQEGISFEKEALLLIAQAGEGSVRDALSLLDQAMVLALVQGQEMGEVSVAGVIGQDDVAKMLGLGDRQSILNLYQSILEGDMTDALSKGRALYEQGSDPTLLLGELMELTHATCILKSTGHLPQGIRVSEEQLHKLREWVKCHSTAQLGRLWQMLLKAVSEVRQAPAPLQALEMIFLRLAHIEQFPCPEALMKHLYGDSSVKAIDVAQPAHQKPSSPVPFHTFEALVNFVREKREGLLYTYLVEDVHMIQFKWGHMTYSLRERGGEFTQQLRSFLKRETGIEWRVEVVSLAKGSAGEIHPTLAQVGAQQRIRAEEEAQGHPLVLRAQELFPGASLERVDPILERKD